MAYEYVRIELQFDHNKVTDIVFYPASKMIQIIGTDYSPYVGETGELLIKEIVYLQEKVRNLEQENNILKGH